MLNGFKLFLRALNDRSLEPMTRTDKPPDRDKQNHAQHYYRGVVEVITSDGSDRWQHKQHRDDNNPNHSNPANWRTPRSQVPWASLEVRRKLAQENRYHVRDIE